MVIKQFLQSVRHHLNFIWVSAKCRILDRLVDKFTFLTMAFASILEITITLIFFETIYSKIDSLAGWDRGEMIILVGFTALIRTISIMTYQRSLNRLKDLIDRSKLDLIITKPVNTHLYLSVFNLDILFSLPQVLFSIFIIYYGSTLTSIQLNWLAFIPLIILGVITHYSLCCLIRTVHFYLRFSHTMFLTEELENLGRFPRGIYKAPFNIIFSTILPIALIFSVPVEILSGKISWSEFAPILLILFLFNLFAQLLFSQGIRNYESNKV